jgi:hypothetical protein
MWKKNGGTTQIIGSDEENIIGNTGDRLKVDAQFNVTTTNISFQTNQLIYDDMNASTGGVARETIITSSTWVDVYSYSGTGYIHAFLVNIEDEKKWRIRLVVDGVDIFGAAGVLTADIHDDDVYDLTNNDKNYTGIGLEAGEHDTIIWQAPNNFPVRFNTSVTVKLKRDTGESNKKFRAGLVTLIKES